MKKILFVCSGNTCRSPMAEALFNSLAADLGKADEFSASSAGLYTYGGSGANPNSIEVCRRHGLSLSAHRSKQFTDADAEEYDWIITMTHSQKNEVLREYSAGGITGVLAVYELSEHEHEHGFDVEDPFGGSTDRYEEVFNELAACLKAAALRIAEYGDII